MKRATKYESISMTQRVNMGLTQDVDRLLTQFRGDSKTEKNKTSPFTKFKAILCSFKRDTRYWYIPFLVVNSSDDERLVVLTTAFVYMTNRFVVASIFLYDRSPLMTSLHGESLRRNSERERFVNHMRSWQSELANNCITMITAKKPSSMKNIGLCNIQLPNTTQQLTILKMQCQINW